MSAQVAARTESFSFELKLKDNFVALGAPEFWGKPFPLWLLWPRRAIFGPCSGNLLPETHLGIRGWGVAGNGSRRSSAT